MATLNAGEVVEKLDTHVASEWVRPFEKHFGSFLQN
jgi:hypothetical protein